MNFNTIAEGWSIACFEVLLYRWERCRVIAETEKEREIVARMEERLYQEGWREKIVIQKNKEGYFISELLHGRFQVAASYVPSGSFYIIDHALHDHVIRERGPGSYARRFPTKEAAYDHINLILEDPVAASKTPRPASKSVQPPPEPKEPKALRSRISQPLNPKTKKPSISGRMQELLLAGGKTDDEIFAVVEKELGCTEKQRSYVQWNRKQLIKEGKLSS